MGRHYSNKTDWQLITKLRDAVGDTNVEKYLDKAADGHIVYPQEWLPTFKTHALVKIVCQPEGGHPIIIVCPYICTYVCTNVRTYVTYVHIYITYVTYIHT